MKNEYSQPQLPRKDGESWFDYLQRATDFEVIEHIEKLEAENESLKAKLDFCGEILGKICVYGTLIQGEKPLDPPPHAAIDAILTQINRAEKAEAERDQALEVIRVYRQSSADHDECKEQQTWMRKLPPYDSRCPTCIKADALLSRKTKEEV